MFTWRHLLWLVICAAMVSSAVYLFKKKRPDLDRVLTIALIVAVLSEMAKVAGVIELVPSYHKDLLLPYIPMNQLPLHLCSIQIVLIASAKFMKNGKQRENLLALMAPTCALGGIVALLMPSIFTNNGFDATMVNPTYAGYKWYPDLSVFDGMENVKAYSTKYSYLPEETKEIYESEHSEVFRHNLFCYSIFQSAPVALQKALYDKGNYNDTRNVDPSRMISQKRNGNSTAYGHEQMFMWEYFTVKSLDQMTRVDDGKENHFIYFATDITHDVEMLQEPEYEPSNVVDNKKYDKNHSNRFMRKGEFMWVRDAKDYKHYQCDVLAYTLIGRWLDYLKEEGVYDNTRIIIVADHGYYLENFPEMLQHDEIGTKLDGEAFAPLLMVKDFNSRGDLKTSEEFMTNADTPYLATKDLVKDPVNPFTGKQITDQGKKGTITVFHSNNWNIRNNNGYVYQPGDWFSLKDSIWKKENWGYLGNH